MTFQSVDSLRPPHGMSYQDIIKPQVHRHTPASPLPPPKYEFCATQLPVLAPSASATSFSSVDTHDRREYGFLGAKGRDVILGLDVVDKVVNILSMELGKRCEFSRDCHEVETNVGRLDYTDAVLQSGVGPKRHSD